MIDRKFTILALNPVTGKMYTEKDCLVLCAKDVSVPDALQALRISAIKNGADEVHSDSLGLLRERVLRYQATTQCRIPDTVGDEIPRCLGTMKGTNAPDTKAWEPVEELMFQAIDSDSNPMKEGPLELDEEQRYISTCIGHDLDDPEGCRSVIEVITGEGRRADEELAQLVIIALQFLHTKAAEGTKAVITRALEKLPEGCPGDCPNHHGLCVGDEEETHG